MHSLSLKMLDFATNLQNMRFAIPVKFTRAKNNSAISSPQNCNGTSILRHYRVIQPIVSQAIMAQNAGVAQGHNAASNSTKTIEE
jgi:hypothetical protein